jgi:hypothetical protein
MMMAKRAPETEEEAPPAFATAPALKKTPQSAVEDLERRLQMLGGSSAPPDVISTDDEEEKSPAAVAPAPAESAAVKGGKNALLVSD